MAFQRRRCEVRLPSCSIEESSISVRDAGWINTLSHKAGSIIGQNLETLSQCGAGGQWTQHFGSEKVPPTRPPTARCSSSRLLGDSPGIFSVLQHYWLPSFIFCFLFFLKGQVKIIGCNWSSCVQYPNPQCPNPHDSYGLVHKHITPSGQWLLATTCSVIIFNDWLILSAQSA